MLPKEAQQAMQQWLSQATPPERQLDRRWIERYRELLAYDSYWWLTWAGPFTQEEQQQWEHLFTPQVNEATKAQLAPLLKQSRDRELAAALAQQREPRFLYPALDILDARRRIARLLQLDEEIARDESNAMVCRLYHGAIEDELNYLRLIEATYEGNTDQCWHFNRRHYCEATVEEMTYALSRLRRLLQQGFAQPDTAEIAQQLVHMLHERFHLSLDLSAGKDDPPVVQGHNATQPSPILSIEAVRRFYEASLREGGYEGWRVSIDYAAGGTRVESGLRQVFLAEEGWTLERVRHLLAHELAGHVARSFAGEHSPIGLLGIGTQGYSPTEEGLALYHERETMTRHDYPFSDAGLWLGTLATGLACGIASPPQTFSSLYRFFETFYLLRSLLEGRKRVQAQERARTLTLALCLRTFRGIPDLRQAGRCRTKDVVYLRGLLLIDRLVAEDVTVLDRLAVGKIAYELLPLLQELELLLPPQPLRELAYDPELDNYILAFESSSEEDERYTQCHTLRHNCTETD